MSSCIFKGLCHAGRKVRKQKIVRPVGESAGAVSSEQRIPGKGISIERKLCIYCGKSCHLYKIGRSVPRDCYFVREWADTLEEYLKNIVMKGLKL